MHECMYGGVREQAAVSGTSEASLDAAFDERVFTQLVCLLRFGLRTPKVTC